MSTSRFIPGKLSLWWSAQTKSVRGLAVATLFVGIGITAVLSANAAKIFLMIDVDTGTVTGTAKVASDAAAAGGKYILFEAKPSAAASTGSKPVSNSTGGGSGTVAGWSCALPKYPTPDCTGAPEGTAFQTINGDYTISSPGVYEKLLVKGTVNICANNVTFRKSIVEGGISSFAINTRDYPCDGQLRSGVLVEDVTVRPTNYAFPTSSWAGYQAGQTPANYANWPEISIGPSGYTCRRCKLISMDGPRIATGLSGADTTSSNILIEDSYIFTRGNAPDEPCNHTDGVQGYGGGTNVIIRHTTVDVGRPCASGGIFMGDNSPEAEVYDSLILGGGYSLKLGSDPGMTMTYKVSNVKIANNTWGYGPSACSGGGSFNFPIWQNVTVVNIDSNYNVTDTVRSIPSCGS